MRLQHLWNVSLPLWNFAQRLTRGEIRRISSSPESLCKWGEDKGRTPKAAYRVRTGVCMWGVGPIIPHFNGYFIAGEELKNDGRTFHTIFQASHIIHPQKRRERRFWFWPWGLLECIILFASLPYTLPLTYCICINPSFPASLPEMRFTSFRSAIARHPL